jgi:hypothetical protein
MDIGDNGGDISGGFGEDELQARPKPRVLPDDLPKSLDDRKVVSTHYTPETEMYDAWQGRRMSLSECILKLAKNESNRPVTVLNLASSG